MPVASPGQPGIVPGGWNAPPDTRAAVAAVRAWRRVSFAVSACYIAVIVLLASPVIPVPAGGGFWLLITGLAVPPAVAITGCMAAGWRLDALIRRDVAAYVSWCRPHPCWACGSTAVFDSAFAVAGAPVRAGASGLCLVCGQVTVYRDGGVASEPSPGELAVITACFPGPVLTVIEAIRARHGQ